MKKVENKQILEDINGLKNKLNEIESLFLESQRQRARLLVDYNNKTEEISIVDNDIAKEKELHKWKKKEIENELKDKTEEFTEKMTALKAEETELLISTAAHSTIQDIHEHNLARLKQLAYEYHIITKEREEEKEQKVRKVFETRVKLNVTMQKMIEAFDKSYRAEEKKKLEDEAELARQKTAQLNLEFDSRTRQIESLVRLQQRNYDENCRLAVEKDVVVAEIQLQQEKAAKLFEENRIDKIKVKELSDIVTEYEKQNEHLQIQLQMKQELLDTSNKLENDLNDTIKHRQKLISTVVLSSQNLISKALDISSKTSSNKAADLLLAAAALSTDDDIDNDINIKELSNDIDNLVEESYNENNINNNEKSVNTIEYDTDIIWNSRREENYQIMSDSIRKFLRKKKRM